MGSSQRVPGAAAAWLAAIAAAMALAACGGSNNDAPVVATPGTIAIRTLSNRADLVSDGDALMEIVLPSSAQANTFKVEVNGVDTSSVFAVRADGRITGLVRTLQVGDNTIVATAANAVGAKLVVTNHHRGGPVFSGGTPSPYVCATTVPQGATAISPATNGSGLSTPAVDANCTFVPEVKLYYKTTATGCSLALPDPVLNSAYTATAPATTATPAANLCFKTYTPGTTPTDLATTTLDTGATVPYIVRVERGSINRGIYDIAVLYDPAKSEWNATAPQAQWNGKLIYHFGASTGQPRRQARPATAWTDDRSLARGYMVAMNSMTDSLKNSNRVNMAETLMMMKERISDGYGPIKFTIGNGCSGGSIASNMTSTIMPGLLDGVTVSCTYPDSETTAIEVGDCVSLVEAYQKPQWLALQAGLTPAQINAKKAAINGHLDQSACHGWYNSFGSNSKAGNYFQRTVPPANNDTGAITQSTTAVNNCELPAALVYDAVTNPNGARCNAWSWAVSIFGRVGSSPIARDTRDNTGVQYGLKALLAGTISAEEFVVLNEIAGGSDADSNLTAARSVADAEALNIAYRSGIVLNGKKYSNVAVIDMRGYDDSVIDLPPGLASFTPAQLQGTALFGIHHQWRSFSIRDRLDRDAGGHGNQVIWRFGRSGFSPSATMSTEAFLAMDQWLTKLVTDTSSASLAQKVVAAKPASAFDYCLLSSDAAQATKVTDFAACDADKYLKPYSSPRQVAGGPRTEDILKCQLKPVAASDYGNRLSAAQLTRLNAVFPSGVCDWSKPGVGQQDSVSPLNFKAGPGGQPFPAAPVSQKI